MGLLWSVALARVQLGNGLTCTWMNNAVASSAVQAGVPNPPWVAAAGQSADRLGYDGAGRMIAKRYLNLAGSSPNRRRRRIHHRLRSREQQVLRAGLARREPQQPLRAVHSNGLPTGGYDSLDRLLQYQRGTLASTGGSGGNGGGSIAASRFDHLVHHVDQHRPDPAAFPWMAWATGETRPLRPQTPCLPRPRSASTTA